MIQEPVEDGGGQDLVVEDLSQVGKALVGCDDEGCPFVTADQEPEEQAR